MRKRRELMFGIILVVMSTLVVVGACEFTFRLALFSESFAINQLRQAWRYADSGFDDDYWKLDFIFGTVHDAPKAGHVDPQLGWVTMSSPENPLGLQTDAPYEINDIHKPILFYGDSFVAGITSMSERIPQVLDQLISNRPVLNYGVSGYGVDQIYLRFASTAGRFKNSIALVGILTDDLDRSILSVRTHQKPYFDVVDGALVVRNTPVLTSMQEYLERHPPQIRSYFLRFVMFRLRPILPDDLFRYLLGYDKRHLKKLDVNRRILRAFKDDGKVLNVPVFCVIFYSGEEIEKEEWRERYLKQTLDELAISYFDTKAYLLEYIARTDLTLRDLYYDDYGHPNEKGNRVIAKGLYKWLKDMGVL